MGKTCIIPCWERTRAGGSKPSSVLRTHLARTLCLQPHSMIQMRVHKLPVIMWNSYKLSSEEHCVKNKEPCCFFFKFLKFYFSYCLCSRKGCTPMRASERWREQKHGGRCVGQMLQLYFISCVCWRGRGESHSLLSKYNSSQGWGIAISWCLRELDVWKNIPTVLTEWLW